MTNRNSKIHPGAWFGVPIADGRVISGQILGREEFGGFLPCALLDIGYDVQSGGPLRMPQYNDVIASISLGKEAMVKGDWHLGSIGDLVLAEECWPNSECRQRGTWAGAKFYDAGIGKKLLDAYYGLAPWDQMHDPAYYDKLLFHDHPDPSRLVYANS